MLLQVELILDINLINHVKYSMMEDYKHIYKFCTKLYFKC